MTRFMTSSDRAPSSSASSEPLVSLHMAMLNTRPYVEQAVRSICRQSYQNWELLVWDDGSNDGSREVVADLARREPRIRLLGGEHVGVYGGLARTIAASSGPYLGWIDSDDFLAPEALAATVASLGQHPQCGAVYTDYYDVDRHGKVLQLGQRCRIPYSRDRLLVDFMTFHFRLLRRSAFEQAGGLDPTITLAQDYDLCLRLSEKTGFHHLATPLYYYRRRPDSVSYARRVEQIECSAAAVRRALVRRGLAPQVTLEVEIIGRFRLLRHDKLPPGEHAATSPTLGTAVDAPQATNTLDA